MSNNSGDHDGGMVGGGAAARVAHYDGPSGGWGSLRGIASVFGREWATPAPEYNGAPTLEAAAREAQDMELHFDGRCQRFTPVGDGERPADKGKLQSALAAMWKRTAAVDDGEDDDDEC